MPTFSESPVSVWLPAGFRAARILAVPLAVLLLGGAGSGEPEGPTLVILSLDGVRHDYPDRVKGGAFQRLEREGVRAESLVPPFPASTFPSHATLATGCYPDRHGILSSRFLDIHLGEYHRGTNPEWLACEPLWVNAEREHLPSAVLNWMGSFEEWGGIEASYHAKEFIPSDDREMLGRVLEFLRKPPPSRPRLVMAYLAGADHVGHEKGPDSPEVNRRIGALDGHLARLLREVDKNPGASAVNLMVVSDHGMARRRGWLDPQGALRSRHLSNRTFASGGVANVYLDRLSDRPRAMRILSGLRGLEVFTAGELPPDLNYEYPGRTGDLVLVAPMGFELGRDPGREEGARGGVHGYRGTEDEMQGIFYGWGPAFTRGVGVSRIDAADVYSLACSILGVLPSPRAQGRLPRGVLNLRREEPSLQPAR